MATPLLRTLYGLLLLWSIAIRLPAQPPNIAQGNSIQNFPGTVPLDAFVESVSRQLGIRILYDDKVLGRNINIRATSEVPNESLVPVLRSALRMNNLALVDADVDGWMKIVSVGELPNSITAPDARNAVRESGGNTPVTQTFRLEFADPESLSNDIKQFLSQGPGNNANVLALKDQRMLIVTDYASNVLRIQRFIELMDQPVTDVETRFIRAVNLDAASLAEKLTQLLAARQKARGKETGSEAGIEVAFDDRTRQLILVGKPRLVAEAEEYLRTLDVEIDTSTEVYLPTTMSAGRVEGLIKGMIEVRGTSPVFRSVVDEEQNLLVVTTTPEVHQEIKAILQRMDVDADGPARNSPVRFYRLEHATADDVLRTIRELEGTVLEGGQSVGTEPARNGRFNLQPDRPPMGVNAPATNLPENVLQRAGQLPPGTPELAVDLLQQSQTQLPAAPLTVDGPSRQLSLTEAVGRARITADTAANTLIVIATPGVHQVYAELIEKLDQPRPQVLIEARLVVIDTSDDFTLGVEVSGGDRSGSQRLFAFTSFGFSEVDAVSGALSIIPGVGFNGTLVDPDVADVVLRAVTGHRRSKVISSPRLLINDHATGHLTSVTEVPFNSFNTFNTVSSTSFAGYAEAGTTITVTPHISQGDQLQLEYSITLNEFQAEAGPDGSPPPRQTDELESIVTIPDGHTIIVGGLTRTSHATTHDSIPFVEQIPVLKHLVGVRSSRWNRSTLFVFLRPVILRDDKFRDLKYISERDTCRSRTPGTFPHSAPLLVK